MSGNSQSCGDAAIAYVLRGWPVIPLHYPTDAGCSCVRGSDCPSPSKHPMIRDWVTRASTDTQDAGRWWHGTESGPNIGILTGSRSGLLILDVDPRHGGDVSLETLEERWGCLPDTVVSMTGGGGRHFWFQAPSDRTVPSSANVGGYRGLDVRAEGGMVVAPPSVHASGRQYGWEASSHPDDVPLALAPAWLQHIVSGLEPAPETYHNWRLWATGADEGTRNTTLAKIAGHLLGHGVDPHLTLGLCTAWNRGNRPPLSQAEVEQIVASIAAAELRKRAGWLPHDVR
ncbi:MAG: bifunctional DNA primase/polymerase [Clostridia bacterium]